MKLESLIGKVKFLAEELGVFLDDEAGGPLKRDQFALNYEALMASQDGPEIVRLAHALGLVSQGTNIRYNRAKHRKKLNAFLNETGHLEDLLRYGTDVALLTAREVADVRAGRVDYGMASGKLVEETISKGTSVCRSCGQKMRPGTRVLMFAWDFYGSGSYTARISFIHADFCPNLKDEVDRQEMEKARAERAARGL